MDRKSNYWTTRATRRRVLGAASAFGVGGVGLALAGCGDDDNKSNGGSSSTGASSSPGTQPSGSATQAPKVGGALILGGSGTAFTSQDPHSTPSGTTVTPRVYNYLIRTVGALSPETPKVPDLAESYQLQPDNVTLVFKIRPNAKVAPNSQGIPERALDSDDVLKNWQRIADPKTGGNSGGFYADRVASIDAPDATTFRMILKKPFAFAIEGANAHTGGTMAPKEMLASPDLKTKPVGAGPYRQTELVDGDHVTMQRNPNYYKTGKPYLDTQTIRLFQDTVTTLTAFQSGQIDTYTAANIDEANQIKQASSKFQLLDAPSQIYTGVWMNVRQAPWNDERARRAVNLALNRSEYVTLIGHSSGTPVGPLSTAFAQYTLAQDELAKLQPFDVKQATALFAQAGVTEFTVQYYPNVVDHFNIFVRQMKAAGVTVKPEPLDIGTWVTRFYTNDLSATIFGHNLYNAPDLALAWFHSAGVIGNGHYDTGFSDAAVDAALDKSSGILSDAERFASYKDAQRLILQKSPAVVNLFNTSSQVLLAENVRDYPKGVALLVNVYLDSIWKA